MGSISARKCFQILRNVQNVIAIEMLLASQGIDFLKPLKCGIGTGAAYNTIRKEIPTLKRDRILKNDLDRIIALLQSGKIQKSVEKVVVLK